MASDNWRELFLQSVSISLLFQGIIVEENLAETTNDDRDSESSESVSSKSVVHHQLSQTTRTDLILVSFLFSSHLASCKLQLGLCIKVFCL